MSAPVVEVPAAAQEALFRSVFVTLRNPLTRPPFYLGLELAMYACAVLTLVHATRARKNGDGWPLFLWACTFAYGILIEVVSYNFVDNFTHGPFTVMFYRDKLPLYVSVLYPVFIYGAAVTVRRLGLGRVAEPFAIGLAIVAIDFPFDICGPIAKWWVWASNDPNIAYRWHGVPVTSYYWHLAFGGVLCMLVRALYGFVSRRARPLLASLLLAFPVGIGTMVIGFVAFLPFHGLKALHVPDGMIVAALLATAAVVTLRGKREPRAFDGLPLIAAIWYGYHAVVAVMLRLDAGRLLAIGIAIAVGVLLHVRSSGHSASPLVLSGGRALAKTPENEGA